jgi:hypothetical protein
MIGMDAAAGNPPVKGFAVRSPTVGDPPTVHPSGGARLPIRRRYTHTIRSGPGLHPIRADVASALEHQGATDMPQRNKHGGRRIGRLVLFSLLAWAFVALGRAPRTGATAAESHVVSGGSEPTPAPLVPKRRARRSPRRLAASFALAVLFFAGASFSAVAGDRAVSLLGEEGDAAEIAAGEAASAESADGSAPGEDPASAEAAPAEPPPAEPAPAEPAPAEPAPAEAPQPEPASEPAPEAQPAAPVEEPAPTTETPEPAVAEPQPAPEAQPAAPVEELAPTTETAEAAVAEPQPEPASTPATEEQAEPDVAREGTSSVAPVAKPAPASHARAAKAAPARKAAPAVKAPPVLVRHHDHHHAQPLDPEASAPGVDATVWLNRALPDPTPPSLRLAPDYASRLVRLSRAAGADWALVLGVLRAETSRPQAPVRPATIAETADRLVELGSRRNAWSAALGLTGRTTTSDRAVALARYYRAIGVDGLVNGLLAEQKQLVARLLADERVEIYGGGREDMLAGRVDVRVVALIAYLAESYGQVTVSCLVSGHRLYARPGVVSAHVYGQAVDIAALGGTPILGHQQAGSVTERAVRDILLLPGEVRARQVISLIGMGGPSFALANHYDHIHVGF